MSEKKQEPVDTSIYYVTDKSAEFPGGYAAMNQFIQNKLQEADTVNARCVLKVSGKIYLRVVVEKNGTLSDKQVLRGIAGCKASSDEALKIVNSMPLWKPALLDGKAVRSYQHIVITLRGV